VDGDSFCSNKGAQEPLGQFQPTSAGNMLGGCFWDPVRGNIRKILINLQNKFFS